MTDALNLVGNCGDQLRELFARRFGHILSDRMLAELLDSLVRLRESSGFETSDEYLALLRTLPLGAPMVQALLQTVTNNESYFFRDPNGVSSLRAHVLPGILERALATKTLRVWSAGCSSGEELYTISILLREMIPDIDFWNIAMVGTDVDAAALARARRGHYKSWSLRVTPDVDRKRYFDVVEGTNYVLRRRYSRGAVFSLHNLADPGQAAPLPGKFDLILCRNVSIYMHQEARSTLAKKLERALAPGGAWIAGPSDPVPQSGFGTRVMPGLLEHTPRTSEPPPKLHAEVGRRDASATECDNVPTWRPPQGEGQGFLQTLVPAAPELTVEPSAQVLETHLALGTARTLADQGESERALDVIDQVVSQNPLEAEAYLLRALLFESSGRLEQACNELKRVTYLEPSRGEAYLRLGLLLARTGQKEQAVKALRNALVLGYGDDNPAAGDLRQTAAMQLMRTLRDEDGVE